MNIENTWRESSDSDDMLHRLLQNRHPENIQSRLPFKKLRKNLASGMLLAAIVTIGYVPLFFLIQVWQVYVALTVLIVFNCVIIADSWRLYRQTPETISAELSLKQELERNYQGFQNWWALQMRLSLFVFPIALTGGFIMGGVLGSEKPVEEFLYNPRMLLILAITMSVVVPLCFLGAKWMFHIGYGRHLKTLKNLIAELS